MQQRILLKPNDAFALNSLATLLADCREPTHRDPEEAVRLAEKAVELVGNSAHSNWILNTLGMARYRNGDFAGAIQALQQAEEQVPGDILAWNGFFLAMAYWQLGNQDESRQWYQRSAEWMEQKTPDNKELLGFRAEAAKLLGISEADQPKPEKKATDKGKDRQS